MNESNTFEDNIQKPGYLLVVTIGLMFLILGFVNLLVHESRNRIVFDQYSVPFFIFMVVYVIFTFVWAGLLFRPNNTEWADKLIPFVQNRPLITLGIFGSIAVLMWTLFTQNEDIYKFDLLWFKFPALQATIFLWAVLIIGFILFYKWNENRPARWRRFLAYGLIGYIVVEIILQGISFTGALPTLTDDLDRFAPYARVYRHTDEGLVHTVMNGNGMRFPELRLEDDSYRVMLMGDLSITALEVEPEENMAHLIDQRVIESDVRPEGSEVFPLGHPDYGPGIYANVPLFMSRQQYFDASEIIVFFDMRNDFQVVNRSNGEVVNFVIEEGLPVVDPQDGIMLHGQLHEGLWGQDGFQMNRYLRSHLILPQLVSMGLQTDVALANVMIDAPQTDITMGNSYAFYDDLNDTVMQIAIGHIDILADYAAETGVKISVVTIPAFPEEFYAQGDTADWTTSFGDADLFLPEQEFSAYAEEKGITFLGMGEYFAENGLTTEEIRALYRDNGFGQLSPAGHALFADAVYACVMAEEAVSGCVLE